MNSSTTRILKEAHTLFWPWCVVMLAATMSWLLGRSDRFTTFLLQIGFFIGIPLLASLSLGNEFRHRTLSLLLSQPVDRMKIWDEKLGITIIAALSATLAFWFVGGPTREDWLVTGLWLIITVGSAGFWTLVSRSALGGFLLNFIQSLFIVACGLAVKWWLGNTLASTWIVSFVILCYAAVMLWLGRRRFAQFQVAGGMADGDLLIAGPRVIPVALAELFRSHPTGPTLNLIRKEFHLLRPLWLLTLLFVILGICLRITSWLIPATSETRLVLSLMFTVAILLPVLGGSLSLGEERKSGMQAWHRTLPVSVRRQWFIKLVMAMFAGAVCVALVPLLTAVGILLMLVMSLLSFATFWCACAANGTMRAVLWVFPAVGALGLAGWFGGTVGGLAAAGTMMDSVVSRVHPYPFTYEVWSFALGPRALALAVVPTVVFAVIQSFRLFRTEPQDSIRSVVRNLLPLASVAFLCGLSLQVFGEFVQRSGSQATIVLRETYEAIASLQLDVTKLDAAHPLQLTVEDLGKTFPMSELARRWLNNSITTVAPTSKAVRLGFLKFDKLLKRDMAHSGYTTTIHLASGWECAESHGGWWYCESPGGGDSLMYH